MRFGFEHDSEEMTVEEENERTPLLVTGNVAPASDPAAAPAIRDNGIAPLTSSANGHSDIEDASTIKPKRNDEQTDESVDKPLPVRQVLLLCTARLVEPIAFFSIFPFINQMCAENGNLPPSDTGFWSGLIESLFSLTQMFVMVLWGRLSDRFGRKPILVISLFGVAFATASFGLAKTLWQMILFRCLAGVFAGTVVTIRTMCTEHSTRKTQARIFSWFAGAGNLGILMGPLLGGALADPAAQYGGVFERVAFFREYPYALSTIVTGSVAIVSAVLTIFFVEETLPPSLSDKKPGTSDGTGTTLNGSNSSTDPDTSIWSLLKAPGVLPVLYLYGHIMLLAFTFTAIMPVFFYEPVELGGFGFSSLLISIFMAIVGISQAIWLLLVFPPLQHRIGTGGVLRICAYCYPLFFATHPLLSMLLRLETHTARVIFFVIAPVTTAVGVGISMAFTAIQLALNDVAPSQQTLGTLNAIALTVVSGTRAFSPAAAASLFAIGIRKQIIYGYLAWVVLIILAIAFSFAVLWLPASAEGKISDDQDGFKTGQENEEDV